MSHSIRLATAEDLPKLLELEVALFPGAHPVFAADFPLTQFEVTAMASILVAMEDDEAVGFAFAHPLPLEGFGGAFVRARYLEYVGVLPEHRGRGIASDLIDHIESDAQSRRELVLTAHIPRSAVSLYRGRGWAVEREQFGFAWIENGSAGLLLADGVDPDPAYPVVAHKVIVPGALLDRYCFPRRSGRPVLDATLELRRRLQTGVGPMEQALPPRVAQAVAGLDSPEIRALIPPERGAFGQRL